MTETKSNAITDSELKVPFWFAVLSPVLGILVGLLGLLLFYTEANPESLDENLIFDNC